MVTSHDLIALLKPVLAKAREIDNGEIPTYRVIEMAAEQCGHSEAMITFIRLALYWQNDIESWIRNVESGLIEA